MHPVPLLKDKGLGGLRLQEVNQGFLFLTVKGVELFGANIFLLNNVIKKDELY